MLAAVTIDDKAQWEEILSRFSERDFYYSHTYHRLAMINGEGTPVLLVNEAGGVVTALPLLVRKIPGTDWQDATSVYGYAGPLVEGKIDAMNGVAACFRSQFLEWCEENRIVSVFSRLHPLLPRQRAVLLGLGECQGGGTTVGIDLTRTDRRSQYRESCSRRLRKLRQLGYRVEWDDARGLSTFMGIYEETMSRVGAVPYYYFPAHYYEGLLDSSEFETFLLIASRETEPAAVALFTVCSGIGQYHLGGTRTARLTDSPMVLLFDHACENVAQMGGRLLHLGGGMGGQQDSLFHFKAGFSPLRFEFQTWRFIANRSVYDELRAAASAPSSCNHFPAYRASLPGSAPVASLAS